MEEICSLVIDTGSNANVVSCILVERLKLPTQRHSEPYKLPRLNEDGEIKVTKQATIKF